MWDSYNHWYINHPLPYKLDRIPRHVRRGALQQWCIYSFTYSGTFIPIIFSSPFPTSILASINPSILKKSWLENKGWLLVWGERLKWGVVAESQGTYCNGEGIAGNEGGGFVVGCKRERRRNVKVGRRRLKTVGGVWEKLFLMKPNVDLLYIVIVFNV